jgi:LuxR family maltose regulon positive regulatory protein
MATPLLSTKLYIPPPRPRDRVVSRPHLTQWLDEGLRQGHRLTLISAPAGFGKTTLLSEWIQHIIRPVAWLSLDEGDNDPARFLAYLIAALQNIEANVGEGVLGALQSPQLPSLEALLAALINQINAIPDDLALVLDDYHLIEAQPVHDALAFLLEHLPGNMHLIVATRSDPPWHMARFRGRGQLAELRSDDLRFTPDEVTELFDQVMGLELSVDDVAALTSRTEGWIAGLQMAALALQATVSSQGRDAERIASFIQAFTGSDRYILDYLVEEVLNRRPQGTKDFLLQTSILDRLSGPLCNAVRFGWAKSHSGASRDQRDGGTSCRNTARNDSQTLLESLEAANLFIVPLDNERCWYRYHHLFADLLRVRLKAEHPDLVPTLHQRAAAWYESNV